MTWVYSPPSEFLHSTFDTLCLAWPSQRVCRGRRWVFRWQPQTPDLGWSNHTWSTAGSLRALCCWLGNLSEYHGPHCYGQMVLLATPVAQVRWSGSIRWVGIHRRVPHMNQWIVLRSQTATDVCSSGLEFQFDLPVQWGSAPEMRWGVEEGDNGPGLYGPGSGGVEPAPTSPHGSTFRSCSCPGGGDLCHKGDYGEKKFKLNV